jgi:hypothetical protein
MQVLLDNATVTAALRAVGLIENSQRELFDLDVVALRVFVEACLLSEQVVVVDNYKEAHTEDRKRILETRGVRFVSFPDLLEEKLRHDAVAHTHNMKMSRLLDSGLDDVFKQLEILFSHAWRNSEGFLVMNALGINSKYGSKLIKAYRSGGHFHKHEDMNKAGFGIKAFDRETRRVAQSLAWAMVRTVYYRSAAKILGGEYIPHPVRAMMNAKCILFDNHPDARNTKISFRDVDLDKYQALEAKISVQSRATAALLISSGKFSSGLINLIERAAANRMDLHMAMQTKAGNRPFTEYLEFAVSDS